MLHASRPPHATAAPSLFNTADHSATHTRTAFRPSTHTHQEGLRYFFQTSSPYTLLVSGTGHAGMEAVVANLLEPGDKIIVGVNGIWGERVSDLAERYGGAAAPGLAAEASCTCVRQAACGRASSLTPNHIPCVAALRADRSMHACRLTRTATGQAR